MTEADKCLIKLLLIALDMNDPDNERVCWLLFRTDLVDPEEITLSPELAKRFPLVAKRLEED